MPQQTEYANITGILARKSADEKHKLEVKQENKRIGGLVRELHDVACNILDASPMVEGERADDFDAVTVPHRLSAEIEFPSGDGVVKLRLREILALYGAGISMDPRPRWGARIEVADDTKSPKERTLYSLYGNMIEDWNNQQVCARDNSDYQPFDIGEPETIIRAMAQTLPPSSK